MVLALLAICINTFACTCGKDTNFKNVAFRTDVTFTPATDTIRTGDTVWMEVHVPQTFHDAYYNRTIRLTDTVKLDFEYEYGLIVKGQEVDHAALKYMKRFELYRIRIANSNLHADVHRAHLYEYFPEPSYFFYAE